MNVDVSPDGRKLTFDLLGDIFTVSSNGGAAVQVTRGVPLNLRPIWAANGSRIIFRSDRSGNYDAYSSNMSGTDIRICTSKERDYYDSLTTPRSRMSKDSRWSASIIDSVNGRFLVVKDSKRRTGQVFIQKLMEDSIFRVRPAFPPQHFSFTPDCKYLVVSYKGKIHKIDVRTRKSSVIPFNGLIKSDLGEFSYHRFKITDGPFKVHYTRSASLSPDRSELVFSALNRIYVLKEHEKCGFQLVDQESNQYQPVYSPDGKWIAYVTWNDTAGGQLWRIQSIGGKAEQLTQISGHYECPSWSRDGEKIAVIRAAPRLFDRDVSGAGSLEIINVSTKSVSQVDINVPLWNKLAFSHDDSSIIYSSADTGSAEALKPKLVSKSLESGRIRVLAMGRGELRDVSQYTVSPDGRFIAFTSFENIYLHPIPDSSRPIVLHENSLLNDYKKIGEGVDPFWSYDGNILNWTYANKLYYVGKDSLITGQSQAARNLNVDAQEYFAKGTIVLANATILSMDSAKIIPSGTIVVTNGRIVDVGESSTVSIPSGCKILDLKGKTIMPGLVDLHCHMRIPSNVFPQQSWMFLINLAYGVTTARDPSLSYDSYGYTELLRTGQMIGPRLITVGRSITQDLNIFSLHDANTVVRKRRQMGGISIKQYALPTRLQRQRLLLACKSAGLNMTNEGAIDPIEQIGMIKDGSPGIEHNPLWGDVHDDVVQFVAKSGVYFTPTLQIDPVPMKEYQKFKYWQYPNAKLQHFTFSDSSQKMPPVNGAASIESIFNVNVADTSRPALTNTVINRRFRNAGGNVCLGSHGNDAGIGSHNELWSLRMGGLTNMQALEAATILGAKALGLDTDIGSIERGKIADLIILNKNPLEDIHNSREIMYVMKDGILYDGDTLDTVWPAKKKCPEWKLKKTGGSL